MPDATVVLDSTFLDRLVRFGGEKLLNNVINVFLSEGPTRVNDARQGALSGNATAVRHALHSLKSSAAQLGAVALSEYCGEGELLAMEGASSTRISAAVDKVVDAHVDVRIKLIALQAGRHGPSSAAARAS